MPLDVGSPELNSGIPRKVYIIAKAWPGVDQDGTVSPLIDWPVSRDIIVAIERLTGR
jgi:hypothetical protein